MSRTKKIAEAVASLEPGNIVEYVSGGEPGTVCTSCGHVPGAAPIVTELAMVLAVHDDGTLTLKLGVTPADMTRGGGRGRVREDRMRHLPGRHVSRVPHAPDDAPDHPGTWRLIH